MRGMRAGSTALPRVIVYVFACPLLPGDEDDELGAELEQVCAQEGVVMVDRVVDRGPPKSRAAEYPVLGRLSRGEADALLVVRSPMYRRGAVADRLEAVSEQGPFAWLSVAELRQADLLPPALPTRVRRRPSVAKRAVALRAQGQTLPQIGQTLTAEGYRAPAGAAWTAASVAKLLGIVVMQGGRSNAAAADVVDLAPSAEHEAGHGSAP